jgi:glycosyltransferase involved in cell wall biosynthesis
MRVLQVVPSVHEPAAGTTTALLGLCATLARRGLDVELHTLAPLPDEAPSGYRAVAHPRWPVVRRLGVSPALGRAVMDAATRADVVHNHGLWMLPNLQAAWAAQHARRPLVCSVHGMLAPWALARSRGRKTLASVLGQRWALEQAACLHATCEAERDEIRRYGLRQPVAVVPFGVELPEVAPRTAPRRGPRRLLFLARLHPKKGLDVLLRAWRAVQEAHPGWELTVCGPDEGGHRADMERLAARLGARRVAFLGPRYGADKDALLAASELFVLPTFHENFGFAVAEALAHGLPAIVTRAAPWQGLEAHHAGWWIETGPEALADCLHHALALAPTELAAMGARGQRWVGQTLRWDEVGARMEATYAWLLGHAPRPAWVG